MDQVSLLRRYQGERTNREYAKLLGVHESYLSKCYSGEQPVGMKALRGLVRAFPASVTEVVGSILAAPDDVADDEPVEVVTA